MSTYQHVKTHEIDEESRRRYRGEIKGHLLEMDSENLRCQDMDILEAGLNEDTEAASVEHAEFCAPLQAEAEALEKEYFAAIRAGKKLPKESADRRIENRRLIAEANSKLEMRAECNRRSIARIRKERDASRMKTVTRTVLENKLVELASPASRDKMACLENRRQWAHSRREASRSVVQLNAERVRDDQEHATVYGRRLSKAELLARDAGAEVAELSAAIDTLRAEMLAE